VLWPSTIKLVLISADQIAFLCVYAVGYQL
jgi:hypothetical protein